MADEQTNSEVVTPTPAPTKWQRFTTWYKQHKKVTIPTSVAIGLVLICGIIYAIPPLRYMALSPFVSRTLTIQAIDATTKTPIHDAEVVLDDHTQKTNAKGQAMFTSIPVGTHKLTIKKSLYDTSQSSPTVPVFGNTATTVSLKANGRRVTVAITDRVSGQPIEGVTITTGKASGVSKIDGKAEVVIPINTTSLNANVSKDGYLPATITLTKESNTTAQLVAAGRMYFLSKQSGTVDVVSTNLDGSDRNIILKGTGNEDDRATSLLASRDWRYLVLQAKRDTPKDALYLIDTKDPQAVRITSGNTVVTAVGWSNHRFVYKEYQLVAGASYADSANWKLHSVRASDKSIATLEKVESTTTSNGAQAYQNIDTPYILDGDTVVYSTYWQSANYYSSLPSGKESGVIAVQADGSNRRFLKSYPSAEISYIETKLYKPQEIHYRVFNANGERRENIMTVNKKIETVPPAQQKFDQDYPTFLISPDGSRAFWAEPRDGKNTLFVGDNNSGNSRQLANLSEYTAYGWFTDKYLLLQKAGSELFITTPDALKAGDAPLKVSDYHKPANNFAGYGYGYGGQ